MAECMINGIPVKFPFEPYEIQKNYMSKVIDCLQNEHNGVLESPTGTGKTLSLLCSSLAWLEVKKAQMRVEMQLKGPSFNPDGEMQESLNNLNNPAGLGTNMKSAFLQWPQIIYSSRTHSQLSQAMNELKRTSYKHMRACILGSREQMCIHPDVKDLESNSLKTHVCRTKVKTRSCHFQTRVEREKINPVFTENTVIDIEDLVKLGDQQKFCPYYMSKELKQQADIVFMPYNYLLDARLRKGIGVDLPNSIIILDEAHNVERICEDAASMQIKSTDITLCVEEVTGVMKMISDEHNQLAFSDTPPDFGPEELVVLKEMLLKFEKALDAIVIRNREEGISFDGGYIFTIFESAGINNSTQRSTVDLIERVCTFMATATEGPFQRRGNGLQMFEDLLCVAYAEVGEDFKQKLQRCYRVHVHVENEDKKFQASSNWLSRATASKTKSECRVLSYWCFSPGFGMNMLTSKGVRCVILTSGTLAPLKPLITELELNVNVKLENPHIVQGDQVCVTILSKGPDGTQLNSSFRTRNDPTYIKSLGMTICNLTRMIPGGLLIFFPSYPLMKMCQDKWQEEGLWSNIYQHKPIFVEPRQKNAFNECIANYYEAIKETRNGAIFMGVCRGKVSEGLDFVDTNGRAVIITGLPYPPLKDPRVILKKRYLDTCRSQNNEYVGGEDWYSMEATKAVNQAIGRVIRHGRDYGAIILLDSRFNNPRVINQMSQWLRGHVKHANNYGEVVRELRGFFKGAEEKFPLVERTAGPSLKLDLTKDYFSEKPGKVPGDYFMNSIDKMGRQKKESVGQVFKRAKFSFKPNAPNAPQSGESSTSGESDEKPDMPSVDEIKEYLMLVRKKIPAAEYDKFIAMINSYARDTNVDLVLETLQRIFSDKPSLWYLLTGFRNFLKPDHRSQYDAFSARYK